MRRAEVPKHTFMILILGLVFFPFFVMVNISFKDDGQFYNQRWGVTLPLHVENYDTAWRQVAPGILNSVIVTASVAAGALFLGSLSAFVFARYNFKGSGFLFFLIIILLMMPGIMNLIPLFVLAKDLKILNTYWAMILPGVAGAQVLCLYILRTFFRNQPKELFEAAQVDGAGTLRQYWHLALPLARPILATLAVLTILGQWNDYIWPTICISDPALLPVTPRLALLSGQYATHWGSLMAGYVVASVPMVIMFFFTMRLFIRGITTGALKM